MIKFLCIILLLSNFAQAHTKPDEELLRITVKGKIGFINLKGKVVIEPQFKAVGHFVDGLAPARKGGTYGYIDRTGKFVIQDIYDYAKDFRGGYGIVYLDGRAGYYSRGLEYTPTLFSDIRSFENNRAVVVKDNGKCGLIDNFGRLIIDTLYTDIVSEDTIYLARTHTDNGYTLIKEEGYDAVGTKLFFRDFEHYESARKFMMPTTSVEHDHHPNFSPFAYIHHYTNDKAIAIKKDSSLCLIDSQRHVVASYPSFKEAPPKALFDLAVSNLLVDHLSFAEGKPEQYSASIIITECNSGLFIVDTSGLILCQPKPGEFLFTPNSNILIYKEHAKRPLCDSISIFNIASRSFIQLPFAFDCFQCVTDHALYGEAGGRMLYIDYSGNIIWQDSIDTNTSNILSINTTRKHYGEYFEVDSLEKVQPYEYDYKVGKLATTVPLSEKTAFGISVDPRDTVTYEVVDGARWDWTHARHIERGIAVVFTNPSPTHSITVETCDRHVNYIMQALDKNGVWRDIEYVIFGCTGFGFTQIPPHSSMVVAGPIFSGSFHTKLRLKVDTLSIEPDQDWYRFTGHGQLYSNEFEGNINPGQLWRPGYSTESDSEHD